MSSFERRSFLRIGAATAMASALSGCFKPLYGSTASGGAMSETLAAIAVEQPTVSANRDFLVHTLHNELVSQLGGFGAFPDTAKRYRLKLSFSGENRTPIVDQTTARAEQGIVIGYVNYTLFEGERTLTSGRAQASVSYARTAQRFATLRAARDADGRLAKTLAEQIRIRLATYFSTGH